MKNLHIILISLIMIGIASCQSNNGDIGVYYGLWITEEVTIDGQPAPIDAQAYTWRFQNNIFSMTHIGEYHDFMINTCLWSENGNTLELDISYFSFRVVFDEMMLYGDKVILTIDQQSGRRMRLSHTALFPDGVTHLITYKIKKCN